jgi:RNA polymerase sigma-70 factor, ECF subfamily
MEIERLIEKHKDAVYRQMVRVCGSQDDAEDALGDAILAALKAGSQLKDAEAFRGWLAKIGARACARSRIRQRVSKDLSLDLLEELGLEFAASQPGPEDDLLMSQTHSCVQMALSSLPDIYKEVYIRREVGGESAEDVARSLDLTISAVKSRLHRARTLVRKAIDSDLGCGDLSPLGGLSLPQ